MSTIPDHIQIKLKNAEGFISKITGLCLKEANYSRLKQINKISVALGEMTQALRAALNYSLWDFAEKNLKSRLSEEEYEKIQWSHDFPIERDKAGFEKASSRILRHISDNFVSIYQHIERSQPYYDEFNRLWHLKILSNSSSHLIPIETHPVHANDVAFIGFKPSVVGNQVIILPNEGHSPKTYEIPCYVYELKMFISRKKKWVLFLINTGNNSKPNLIPYIQSTNQLVNQMISSFYALW